MSKKKQKTITQRNLVAKYARNFNKSVREVSDKQKLKHGKIKHQKLEF